MSTVLEYTLSLQDQVSSKLKSLGLNSDAALDRFSKLQKQALGVKNSFKDLGVNIETLKQKLHLLKSERDLIPVSNIRDIRRYNEEITKLENNLSRLQGNSKSFGSKLSSALSNIPGMDLITNPILLAGTAMATTTTMALKFEENMAKINTTAQLSKSSLGNLSDDILSAGLQYGASDMGALPVAYEKIISQTGDVAQSMDILGMSVKGSKAGFTDQIVVAEALAQTLSLVGKENANAQEVLDTFFAAKRVGAGEFKDFAHYMPNLIASGKALGIAYKDVAGQFAYMTGKGFSAEKSATLLENAYTALGNIDITDGLKNAGINVFDEKGSIQSFDKIFAGLQKKMGGMSDEKKVAWLGSIKIKDAQAKSAFMALASDSGKLTEALKSTNKAAGESDKAFQNAQNPMMKILALWGKIQFAAIKFGQVLGVVVSPVLDGLLWLFDGVSSMANSFITALREGSLWVWGFSIAIGAIAIGMGVAWIAANSFTVAVGILNFTTKIASAATRIWAGVNWLLTESFLANPITWIVVGIIALIAVIGYVIYKTDGWGKMWTVVVNNAKISWEYFTSMVSLMWISTVNGIMNGINKIKIGWYSFKNAIGVGDEGENNSLIAAAEGDVKRRQAEIKTAEERKNKAYGNLKNIKNSTSELSWNNKSLGDFVGGVKNKVSKVIPGIAPAKIPGGLDNDMSAFGGDGKKGKKKGGGLKNSLDKTNEATATGGTKHNYITINIKDLVGILNISGKDFKETTTQLQQQVEDALMRTLASAETAAI